MADRSPRRTPVWFLLAAAFGAAAALLAHAAPVFDRYNVIANDLFPEMRRLYLAQRRAMYPFPINHLSGKRAAEARRLLSPWQP